LKYSVCRTLICGSTLWAGSSLAQGNPPEHAFDIVAHDISYLDERLDMLKRKTRLNDALIYDGWLKVADQAFAAKQYDRASFYYQLLNESKYHLNKQQVEHVLYNLAESHHALEDTGRALKYYREYLYSVTTHFTASEGKNVSKALLEVAQALEKGQISTIAAYRLASDLMNTLKAKPHMGILIYLAAKSAGTADERAMVEKWLTNLDDSVAKDAWIANSLLLVGDDNVRQERFTEAAKYFDTCLKAKEAGADVKSSCAYRLAKIHRKAGKPRLALKFLAEAQKLAPSQQALLEEVAILVALKQYGEASKALEELFKSEPDNVHPDLQEWRVYLAVANSDYDKSLGYLKAYETVLNRDVKGVDAISFNPTAPVKASTVAGSTHMSSKLVSRIDRLDMLAEEIIRQRQILNKTKEELKFRVIALQRSDLGSIFPEVYLRYLKIEDLAGELVVAGEKLAFMQRKILLQKMTDIEKRKLEVSERQRNEVIESLKNAKPQPAWRSLSNLISLDAKSMDGLRKLAEMKSKLAAEKISGVASDSGLEARISAMESKLKKALEILAGRELLARADLNGSHGIYPLFKDYSHIYLKEVDVFKNYQDQVKSAAAYENMKIYKQSTKAWVSLADKTLKEFERLSRLYQENTQIMLTSLANMYKDIDRQESSLEEAAQRMERIFGNAMAEHREVALRSIDKRKMLVNKWRNDIDLLKQRKQVQGQRGALAKAVLENEILQEALDRLDRQTY
jgi:hypothetical protein